MTTRRTARRILRLMRHELSDRRFMRRIGISEPIIWSNFISRVRVICGHTYYAF